MRLAFLFAAVFLACSAGQYPASQEIDGYVDSATTADAAPAADLAHDSNLARDLADPADLAPSPAPDMATCGRGCGGAGEVCCPNPSCVCAGGLACNQCGGSITRCWYSACGGAGEPCCLAPSCYPNAQGTCLAGLACAGMVCN